jgi:hypothetical protein
MRTAGTPLRAAPFAITAAPVGQLALLLWRFPQSTSREPPQHGVRMSRRQLPQRRQEFFLCVRTEGCGFSADDDGPVLVAWRHVRRLRAAGV